MCRVIYVVLHPTPYTLHPTPYTLQAISVFAFLLLPPAAEDWPGLAFGRNLGAAAASCRSLHPTPCTLHPTPCTLHPAQPNHAPHPTPCTSHPAPRTLHPTPTPTESSGTRGEICNGSYLDEEKIPVFKLCPRLQGLSLFLLSLSLSLLLSLPPSLPPSLPLSLSLS